jgi:disulfide bond formation protein DsbB
MAAGALTLVVLAVIMTQLWALNACYMCVFQRLLYLGIMLALLVSWWRWSGNWVPRFALAASTLISIGGIVVAGYQSWLQWAPGLQLSCGAGNQNLMEQIVEWLGQLSPILFMATGFCEDDSFKIFTLSLANWSLFFFVALGVGSLALLYCRCQKQPGNRFERYS